MIVIGLASVSVRMGAATVARTAAILLEMGEGRYDSTMSKLIQ